MKRGPRLSLQRSPPVLRQLVTYRRSAPDRASVVSRFDTPFVVSSSQRQLTVASEHHPGRPVESGDIKLVQKEPRETRVYGQQPVR